MRTALSTGAHTAPGRPAACRRPARRAPHCSARASASAVVRVQQGGGVRQHRVGSFGQLQRGGFGGSQLMHGGPGLDWRAPGRWRSRDLPGARRRPSPPTGVKRRQQAWANKRKRKPWGNNVGVSQTRPPSCAPKDCRNSEMTFNCNMHSPTPCRPRHIQLRCVRIATTAIATLSAAFLVRRARPQQYNKAGQQRQEGLVPRRANWRSTPPPSSTATRERQRVAPECLDPLTVALASPSTVTG